MPRPSYELGLGLSEEHTALADSVRAFVERTITSQAIRKHLEAGSTATPPDFWPALVDQDLLGLHIPEDMGGSGGGLLTLAVALEALGRSVAPGPFVSTVLASALLAADDSKIGIELLPRLIDGSHTAAVALGDPLVAEPDGTGTLTVTGVTHGVLGALHADEILVPIEMGDDMRWAVIEAADLVVTSQDSVDVLRGSARVEATGVTVPADRVLEHLDSTRVRSIATVVMGAEALGVMSWCVSTAAEYAKLRVQFGRPIGQFQAIKHKCAHMGIALEQSRAVLWDAASALDKGDETADFAADMAAVIVPDAAVQCAQDCIQVHGAIGFTWEHDAHLYYRRALAIRGLFGTRDDRANRVADHALAGVTRSLELELPPEAEDIRARVRTDLAPIAGLDEDDQLIRLGDDGWVQPHLPPPFGRGSTPLEQIVISQELKSAGIALPQLLMGGWAAQAVVAHGTEAQKRELAAPTLRGELVWCQLFSEPGAGSDLASISTRAEKVDGGWRINGQKIWTTVAQFAEWAMLIARTNPSKPKHDGITYFVLDMATAGVTTRPLREITGMALFNEVFLDDVLIPDEHVVGAVDGGWDVARTTLAGERVALSQKMDAYATDRDLLAFASERELSPVARYQLGELIAESRAVDLLGSRVILKQLSGADVSTTSSVCKLLAMRMGQQISEYVVATLGPAGTVSIPGQPGDKAMDQLLAGRATTIYGGTTEVQLNVIGERMLGLPRDAAPVSGS